MPSAGQSSQRRPRSKWTLVLPAAIGLIGVVVSLLIDQTLRSSVEKRLQTEFLATTTNVSQRIDDELNERQNAVRLLTNIAASNPNVTKSQFLQLTTDTTVRKPNSPALLWMPISNQVDGSSSSPASRQHTATPAVRIAWRTDRQSTSTSSTPSTTTDSAAAPLSKTELAATPLIDPIANPAIRTALARANTSRTMVATEPMRLTLGIPPTANDRNHSLTNQSHAPTTTRQTPETTSQKEVTAVLLISPVFRHDTNAAPIALNSESDNSQNNLIGFALGILPVSHLIDSASQATTSKGLQLEVWGTAVNKRRSHPVYQAGLGAPAADPQFNAVFNLDIADTHWQLKWASNPAYLNQQRGWSSHIVRTTGILVSALLTALLWRVMSHSDEVESRVRARTAALSKVTDQLHEQAKVREELAAAVSRQRDQTQHILDALPSIVILKDCQNRILRVNRRLTDQIGSSREDVEGRLAKEVFPLHADRYFETDQEIMRTGEPVLNEILPLQDGWICTDKVPTVDQNGKVDGIIVVARDVTESRNAEEIVRLAFDASPSALLMIRDDQTITMANISAAKLFGYEQQSMIGKSFDDLLPDHSEQALQPQHSGNSDNPPPHSIASSLELSARHARGHQFPVEVALTPVSTSEGHAVVASVIDLSELRANEFELLNAKELLEKTSRLASVGGWELKLDPLSVRWSDEVCRIHGMPPGTQPDLDSAINFYAEEYRDFVSEKVSACMNTGQPFDFEVELLTATGRRIWVHSIGEATYENGRIVGLTGTFQDVDEKRRAEIALRDSEHRLETALVNSNVGLWDWNITSGTVVYSPTWKTQLGYSAREPWNSFEAWEKLVHPDDLQPATDHLNEYLAGEGDYFQVIIRMRHADGKYRWIRSRAKAQRNLDGTPERMVGVHVDITDQIEVGMALEEKADELSHAVAALEQSNEDLQQFAYVASHDLQTPLRGISGYAGFLKEDFADQLDDEAVRYIDSITDGCQRMRTLINDLLTYSRVDAGPNPFETIDLGEIVDEIAQVFEASIDVADYKVEIEQLPILTGDRSQMSQLLQNLIGNALKYRGEQAPRIRIFSEQTESGWKIGVTDNGIGIDPAQHQKIFEPFRRLHNQREYPGTGIGLAICRRIVERHGGQIWIESAAGQGSSFYFTLPTTQPDTISA